MKSSATSQDSISAVDVFVSSETLTVDLSDGRRLSVPLSWYPRLMQGTDGERGDWKLRAHGSGIHWPQLDEDISVAGLIAGRRSNESESSLRRWMNGRDQRKD